MLFATRSAREAAALYDGYYDAATFATPPGVAASLERLVVAAGPYRRVGRWLDVGYGEGGLLAIADKHGWSCHGIEIAPPALKYGRRRGWRVAKDGDDPRFGAGAFDVVSMVELIEHLETPRQILTSAARWLRPGGLLYLTTPNADSLNRRLLGPRWSVIAPPEHVTVWTSAAIHRALGDAGFVVRRLRSEGYNPADLLNVSRRRAGAARIDRNELGRALSDTLDRSRSRRAVKTAVNVSLNALRLGDTLKVWAERAR